MAPKPDAFLSYTRFDDRHGKITDFRQWLSETVQEVSGKPFQIFQDVDDEQGIGLGQKWKDVLEEILDQARFFIPILTPSFFESKPCRAELTKFLELEQKAGRQDLVLPIYYIECPVLEDPSLLSQDALAAIVSSRQHWDWRQLRHRPFTDTEVAEQLEALARQIERARRQRFTVIETPQKVAATGGARTAKLEVVEPAKEPTQVERSPPRAVPHPQPPSMSLTPGIVFRDIDKPWCPEMVVIPAGQFLMGSPDGVGPETEHPQHEVVFAQSFALGRFPVTFEEYDYFCEQTGRQKPHDSEWGRGRRPVINVSWEDAQAYCKWLSEITEQSYRLPSEAEWEYGCRAGTTAAYAFGDQITWKQANFGGNVKKTTEVDSYPANKWELHDMHGNVWEWVEDCWNGTYEGAPTDGSARLSGDCSRPVVRGGSWNNSPRGLHSAYRDWGFSGGRGNDDGFRVARTL